MDRCTEYERPTHKDQSVDVNEQGWSGLLYVVSEQTLMARAITHIERYGHVCLHISCEGKSQVQPKSEYDTVVHSCSGDPP
jgi:hypothetical protein